MIVVGFLRAWLWPLLASMMLAGLGAVPAAAAPVLLKACVAPAHAGDTAAAMLANPARFDCSRAQAGFGPGDFWVRLTGPGLDKPGTMLQLGAAWQDAVTIHVGRADGTLAARRIDQVAWAHAERIGAVAEFALPGGRAAVTDLLLRVDGAANIAGVVPLARLATTPESRVEELGFTALYAGFAGICLALLGYNFVLWLTLRERFQAIYCVMTLATMGYATAFSGALARMLPGVPSNTLLCVNYATLALVAGCAVQFVRHFFEVGMFSPAMERATDLACAGLATATVAFLAMQPGSAHLLDRIYLIAFVPIPVLTVAMIVCAWRRRSPLLKFYLAAWTVPMIMAGVRIVHSAHLIAYSPWIDQSTVLAMVCELLVSSLGIAYRIKQTNEERDRARAEEAVARRLADSDPLTGLLNRRAFLERLTAAPGDYGLLLVDVDHFKQVNDAYGHDAGDQVLQGIAVLLRAWGPGEALVARLGGEEFGIAVRGGIPGHVEALLAQVRRQPMTMARPVTVSIGIAHGHVAGESDWRALYRAADAALYGAKAAGRDRAGYAPVGVVVQVA